MKRQNKYQQVDDTAFKTCNECRTGIHNSRGCLKEFGKQNDEGLKDSERRCHTWLGAQLTGRETEDVAEGVADKPEKAQREEVN